MANQRTINQNVIKLFLLRPALRRRKDKISTALHQTDLSGITSNSFERTIQSNSQFKELFWGREQTLVCAVLKAVLFKAVSVVC